MAWDTVLVERLRYYINDLSGSPTWTDTQLKRFITLGAIEVSNDLAGFIDSYTINTASGTIDPDPTEDGSNAAVGSIFVLKAASILSNAEVKQLLATAGFKVTDDRSSIDTTSAIDAAKSKVKLYTDEYLRAIKNYQYGNTTEGEAVLAPYTSRDSITYNYRSI